MKRSLALIQCPIRNPNILSVAHDFPNHHISPLSLCKLASSSHDWASLLQKHALLFSSDNLLLVFVNSPTFFHFLSTCSFKPNIDVLSTCGEFFFSTGLLSVKPEIFPLHMTGLQFYFVILRKIWQPLRLTSSWIRTQKLLHLLSTRCSIKGSSKTQEYRQADENKLGGVALDIDKLLT